MEQETINLILGIWGAGLSTYLGYTRLRRNVRLISHCKSKNIDAQGNEYGHIIAVRAVNLARRPIEIRSVGFETTEGIKHWAGGDRDLPTLLQDGESVTVTAKLDVLASELGPNEKYVQAFSYDAEARRHKTKVLPDVMVEKGVATSTPWWGRLERWWRTR